MALISVPDVDGSHDAGAAVRNVQVAGAVGVILFPDENSSSGNARLVLVRPMIFPRVISTPLQHSIPILCQELRGQVLSWRPAQLLQPIPGVCNHTKGKVLIVMHN